MRSAAARGRCHCRPAPPRRAPEGGRTARAQRLPRGKGAAWRAGGAAEGAMWKALGNLNVEGRLGAAQSEGISGQNPALGRHVLEENGETYESRC